MSVFLGPGPLVGLAPPKLGSQRIRTPKDYLHARAPVCNATEGDAPTSASTSAAAAAPSKAKASSTPPPSSSRTPWASSAWPRSSSGGAVSPVCRECGGRGVITSAAGRLPCPSCLAWRRRPDYRPGQPLLSVKDLDLKSLDPGQQMQQQATPQKRFEAESSGDEFYEDEETAGGEEKRKKKSRGGMTEQKRLAIKQAMQNRGPLGQDHKRRISNAMRERYAADPSLRQAGKPKKCSHCGEPGHNRKKCPLLIGESSGSGTEALDELLSRVAGKDVESGAATAVGNVCSICGSTGHNRRSCPQAPAAGATSGEDSSGEEAETASEDEQSSLSVPLQPVKVIGITEESVENADTRLSEILAATAAVLDEEVGLEAEAPPPPPPPPLPTPQPAQQLRVFPGSGIALAEDGSLVFSLPTSPEQCVAQAAGAVLRAWDDGIRRQSLELLLPQPASADADAWPGGIRQQFRAALPMVESFLLRLKRAEGLEGRITAEWLDEGDCVGAWQSERLAAVVFPTADALPAVRRVDDALSGRRLMLVVNPQWQPEGQVVSDFGFGRSRRASERYVASLEEVYYLRRVRILGDEVRVLRCFPAKWQVHYVRAEGNSELVAIEEDKPSYQRLLEVLQGVAGSRASKSWLDRALDRGYFADISAYTKEVAKEEEEKVEEEVVRDIVTGEVVGRRRRGSGGEGGGGELL